MTTPTRLRNWAALVRETGGEVVHPDFCERVAAMLEGCAKREDEYKARIVELEDDVAGLLRDTDMLFNEPYFPDDEPAR